MPIKKSSLPQSDTVNNSVSSRNTPKSQAKKDPFPTPQSKVQSGRSTTPSTQKRKARATLESESDSSDEDQNVTTGTVKASQVEDRNLLKHFTNQTLKICSLAEWERVWTYLDVSVRKLGVTSEKCGNALYKGTMSNFMFLLTRVHIVFNRAMMDIINRQSICTQTLLLDVFWAYNVHFWDHFGKDYFASVLNAILQMCKKDDTQRMRNEWQKLCVILEMDQNNASMVAEKWEHMFHTQIDPAKSKDKSAWLALINKIVPPRPIGHYISDISVSGHAKSSVVALDREEGDGEEDEEESYDEASGEEASAGAGPVYVAQYELVDISQSYGLLNGQTVQHVLVNIPNVKVHRAPWVIFQRSDEHIYVDSAFFFQPILDSCKHVRDHVYLCSTIGHFSYDEEQGNFFWFFTPDLQIDANELMGLVGPFIPGACQMQDSSSLLNTIRNQYPALIEIYVSWVVANKPHLRNAIPPEADMISGDLPAQSGGVGDGGGCDGSVGVPPPPVPVRHDDGNFAPASEFQLLRTFSGVPLGSPAKPLVRSNNSPVKSNQGVISKSESASESHGDSEEHEDEDGDGDEAEAGEEEDEKPDDSVVPDSQEDEEQPKRQAPRPSGRDYSRYAFNTRGGAPAWFGTYRPDGGNNVRPGKVKDSQIAPRPQRDVNLRMGDIDFHGGSLRDDTEISGAGSGPKNKKRRYSDVNEIFDEFSIEAFQPFQAYFRKFMASSVMRVDGKVKSLQSHLTTLIQENEGFEQSNSKLLEQIEWKKNKINELEKQLEGITANTTAEAGKLETVRGELQTLRTEKDALSTETQQLRSEKAELEKTLNEQKTAISGFDTVQHEVREQLLLIQGHMAQFKTRGFSANGDLAAAVDESKKFLVELEKEKSGFLVDKQKFEEEKVKLKAQIQTRMDLLKTNLDSVENLKDELGQKTKAAEEQQRLYNEKNACVDILTQTLQNQHNEKMELIQRQNDSRERHFNEQSGILQNFLKTYNEGCLKILRDHHSKTPDSAVVQELLRYHSSVQIPKIASFEDLLASSEAGEDRNVAKPCDPNSVPDDPKNLGSASGGGSSEPPPGEGGKIVEERTAVEGADLSGAGS